MTILTWACRSLSWGNNSGDSNLHWGSDIFSRSPGDSNLTILKDWTTSTTWKLPSWVFRYHGQKHEQEPQQTGQPSKEHVLPGLLQSTAHNQRLFALFSADCPASPWRNLIFYLPVLLQVLWTVRKNFHDSKDQGLSPTNMLLSYNIRSHFY